MSVCTVQERGKEEGETRGFVFLSCDNLPGTAFPLTFNTGDREGEEGKKGKKKRGEEIAFFLACGFVGKIAVGAAEEIRLQCRRPSRPGPS